MTATTLMPESQHYPSSGTKCDTCVVSLPPFLPPAPRHSAPSQPVTDEEHCPTTGVLCHHHQPAASPRHALERPLLHATVPRHTMEQAQGTVLMHVQHNRPHAFYTT